jgi:adenylosuccinate lyase
VEEPFEDFQVGSSAMPYKRNPMRAERIGALTRYVIVNSLNPAITAASQWFERTLDDSANRRIAVPEAFLAIDGILLIYANVVGGLEVHTTVIRQHFLNELPFMATEEILRKAVEKGGDRQKLTEKLRALAEEVRRRIEEEGSGNDLGQLVVSDPAFGISGDEMRELLEISKFVGRAGMQVREVLELEVAPILAANQSELGMQAKLAV